MLPKATRLSLAVACALPALARGADEAQIAQLPAVVVTAAPMEEPLKVVTDPKAPRQPLPAHDGADYLKTIPGFSVIRKGGTDGDPVFRGMAGSRLGILLDGEQILGGCGNRMDPPTAYVFPEAYDRITVIKGPQTVLYGPGSSAGTVLFERDIRRFPAPGAKFNGSVTLGSFGRNDAVADLRAGTPDFYAQATATHADADDYEDGDGNKVHSRYSRWSGNVALGWTPDEHTRIELTGARSDGEAAYADRTMDGVKFDRENLGIKFERQRLSGMVEGIEAQAYYNYIDHVMDNFSLRDLPAGTNPMVSNPDRETVGARGLLRLAPGERVKLALGADFQANLHTLRSTMNQATMPYEARPRVEDASFRNYGLFGEATWLATDAGRVVAGLRADRWHAQDKRATVGSGATAAVNPTADKSRDETLVSGFARYEHDFAAATAYGGLGRAERFPDYWELVSAGKEGESSRSAFDTRPETTTQLDVGLIHHAGALSASVSAFYNRIDDFILTQSGVVRTAPNRTVVITRNVDAESYGTELGLAYALGAAWKLDGSLAWVRGNNETDDLPLAQLPPLEARLGVNYDDATWSAGALLRLVARQDRVAPKQGNIVGQDIGPTPGFAVFSLNGGWRPRKGMLLAAGVDNLFHRTYAEHISRAGASVAGFLQTTRVNEPGRTLWVKLSLALP